MAVIPGGFALASVKLVNSALTRPAAVTFGFERATAMTPTENANMVLQNFLSAFQSKIDNAVTIGPATIRIGVTTGEALAVVSSDTPAAGGISLASPPPNVAVLLRKTSDRGGRRGRGRMYMPWGLAEADIDEAGKITASVVTAWTTACAAWLAAHVADAAPIVLLHEPGVTSAGAPDEVTGMFCDPVVATQRRRLVRA